MHAPEHRTVLTSERGLNAARQRNAEQHVAKTYDAIVVGSGACGSWAAMELTQAGLQVLMLEAGAHVDPATDFQHTFLYQMDYRGLGKPGLLRRYAGSERNYRIMLDNEENPYTTGARHRLSLGPLALSRRPHRCTGRAPPIAWPTTSSRPRRSTATA